MRPASRARPVATREALSAFQGARPASRIGPGYSNVLCLSDEELEMVEHDLEFAQDLEIGSKAEIAVLSALSKRVEKIDTEGCLAIFDMIDSGRKGYVTAAELASSVASSVVQDYVERTGNATLRGLLEGDQAKFQKVFALVSKSDAGVLTKAEWTNFVREVAVERVRYMRVTGLLYGRCYWGLGLDADRGHSWPPLGYLADFWFYVKNYHPLLSLFLRDEAHPYSKRDACCAELIRQAYCLAALWLVRNKKREWTTPSGALHNWRLSVVAITVPVMIIKRCLFLLLACPCLRFERRGREEERRYAAVESILGCLGHVLVWPTALGAAALLAYALATHAADHAAFAFLWLAGLLSEYLLTWPLLKLALQFSLCPADERACSLACSGLCAALECGRWASERRRASRLALDDAGDDDLYAFFISRRANKGGCCTV